LDLWKDEGEKWIINLIRETRIGADAKIDLEKARFFTSAPHFLPLIGLLFTEHNRDSPPPSSDLPIRHQKEYPMG